MSAPLTLGTAGHIDHGKTVLVAALTGKDTDRLPDEKRRGISIDLGYAPLVLPSGRQLSVVDAPGHERFVRTMVAGATGIDLFLLCVAADDGVMPQTREHAAVLRALGVRHGVVAVTRADLADPTAALEAAAELVPEAEGVAVAAPSGRGLGELVDALERVAGHVPSRAGEGGSPRLHVDRSFTLRGIGTVVTGTLWSGELAAGDRVVLLPRGLEARVRSVQVHDEQVQSARAGQRVALNLAGPGWRELARGDVVTTPAGALAPTWKLDARLELSRPVDRERVQVHHGTRETPARLIAREGGLSQLRLERQLVAEAGDRIVIRQIAPPDTLGGGEVVDSAPGRHTRRPAAEPLPARALQPEPLGAGALRVAALLESDGFRPRADGDLVQAAGLEQAEAAPAFRALEGAGRAVRVGRNLHFAPEPLRGALDEVVGICRRDGQATIASVRDELDLSRRLAQALLEHLDATKVTRRRGDAHVLRG